MSVQSEITRLTTNVSNALDAIGAKGVLVPVNSNSDDLAELISQITCGSGSAITIIDEEDPNGGIIRHINAVSLAGDTVSSATLMSGYTAHNSLGELVTGTATGSAIVQTKSTTFTPTESTQTKAITPDTGYNGLSKVNITVNAISSTYVGSGIITRSSADLTASGATITVPSGYYAMAAAKSVEAMTLPTSTSNTSSGTKKATISPTSSSQYLTISTGYNDTVTYYEIGPSSGGDPMVLPTATSTTFSGTRKAIIEQTSSTKYLNIPIGTNSSDAYYEVKAIEGVTIPTATQLTVPTGSFIATLAPSTRLTFFKIDTGYLEYGAANNIFYTIPSISPRPINVEALTVTPASTSQTFTTSSEIELFSQTNAWYTDDINNRRDLTNALTVGKKYRIHWEMNYIDQFEADLPLYNINDSYVTCSSDGVTIAPSITLYPTYLTRAGTYPSGTGGVKYNFTFYEDAFDGYGPVVVNGDSDLVAENIKSGVSIFGIEGTYNGGVITPLYINPTTSSQYYDGSSTLYTIPTGDYTSYNIDGKCQTYYISNVPLTIGNSYKVSGTIKINDTIYTLSDNAWVYNLSNVNDSSCYYGNKIASSPEGYFYIEKAINNNRYYLTMYGFKSNSYTGQVTTAITFQENSDGYLPISVSGDENLISGNIKNGVSIFGITGTYGGASPMTLPTTTSTVAVGTQKATISRSTSSQYLNIPTGNNEAAAYYEISATPNGSATTPTKTITPTTSITVSANGLVTASITGSSSITPTVNAGYISSGTEGTVSVSGSSTFQLTTKAAATYTPTTTNQTISSGIYLTGVQTISGDSNLVASNIISGVSIFGVSGSVVVQNYYTGSSAPSSSTGSDGDLYLQS